MAYYIDSTRQLFIDSLLIDELCSTKKVLNPPDRLPVPVLEGTESWEGWIAGICGNSVHWGKEDCCFKMWYDTAGGVAYATSKDGVHWEKPHLDILGDNNLISPGRNFSVIKDNREPDPSKRYKALYWHSLRNPQLPWSGKGHHVAFSADGVHWQPYPQNPTINFSGGLTDGQFVLGWDPAHSKYIAYMRPMVEFFDPPKRAVAWVGSKDFLQWDPPVLAIAPDHQVPADVEYYRMTVAKYQGIYLGFLWVYHNDPDFIDQSRDTGFAASRDGITWHTPFDQATYFASGAEEDWDSRFAGICNLIPVGNELYFYYSGANIPHNVKGEDGRKKSVSDWVGRIIAGQRRTYAVGLAKLRRDGFVSVEPQADQGTLTTKPLTFLGTRLHLNLASAEGSVAVEILDRNGAPIEGYSVADCVPISADSTDYVVQWKGRSDLVPPPDASIEAYGSSGVMPQLRRPVRIKFYLEAAKLYSFWID